MKERIGILFLCTGLLCGQALEPSEAGVPAELGGNVQAAQRGTDLWLSARLPEPGGKVLARSFGKNPVWEKDALESPPVEDRMRWLLRYKSAGGIPRNLSIEVNPWGAYRIEEEGDVLAGITIPTAADVSEDGWTMEAAVPVTMLDIDWDSPQVQLRAERIRSRRALAPEFRWHTDLATLTMTRAGDGVSTRLPHMTLGNTDPPLEIGRVLRLPPVEAQWEQPAWQDIPEFGLSCNQPYPCAPAYPTELKWMHDGRTLALVARLQEPEPVVARAGGRDSAVTGDDHIAIYLATTGSAFLEIAVNTVGAVRDSIGNGPHAMRPTTDWDAGLETQTDIGHGEWIARVNIPLDECARALGETGIPTQWRILVARHRAARPGEAAEWSTLPPMGGVTTFYGPIRYQAMLLRESDPTQVNVPPKAGSPQAGNGLSAELPALDAHVWTPLYRRSRSVRTMVHRHLEGKVKRAVLEERHAWDKANSREDWEQFRDQRIQGLKESVGQYPPSRPALEAQVTATHTGEGYRLENIVYQTRPGFWMTANLYLPAKPSPPIPAIIIVHSQHYPKTQGELHDMGELWARTGAAVLIIERPGYGERTETTPWFRQGYGSRFNFTKQLFLAGESYSGWAAWDVIRSVDFLYERPEIDKSRVILIGSVAGGGEIAGVAGALDPRIAAVVPFNYDQGHVRVHGDSPGQIANQFSPWLVAASVAPRKFVRAFEFGWEGAEEPDYPGLWVDGMERSRKVWAFYNAPDNLESSRAYGLIRLSMERVSHCFSVGPQQREDLYPIFDRWLQIPIPSEKDLAILPDSQLSTNPLREQAGRQEAERRRPNADLLSMPPAVAAEVKRKAMHEIALETGNEQLSAARSRRRPLAPAERRKSLRQELKPILGEIDPPPSPQSESLWKRTLSGAQVEGISLAVEDGIDVPLILIRPSREGKLPVVVGVAQTGKQRFLTNRAREVEALVRAGIAVCLPDVRATGETAPAPDRTDGGPYHRIAQTEFDLGQSLLGSRLKDLRSVLAYLRSRGDVDESRIALWGDSFTPANPRNLWLDELEFEAGPQIQYRAEPMGAHLALLAALYEDGIQSVVAAGGLAGYVTVLENPFTYVPMEDILLGVLKAGDVADIAGALAPRPLLMERSVNGRNVLVEGGTLGSILEPARTAYQEADSADHITVQAVGDIAAWLVSELKK